MRRAAVALLHAAGLHANVAKPPENRGGGPGWPGLWFALAGVGGRIASPPMKLLKIIAFVFGAIVALTVFGKIRQRVAAASAQAALAKDPGLSPQGFWLMKRGEEKTRTVTVFVPENCPSAEAARARALLASIQAAGIPCESRQGMDLKFDNPDDFERVKKYGSNVENPLVVVKGWAKGNPTAQQVIAQYRSAP